MFKSPFSYKGRIGRLEYTFSLLFYFILSICCSYAFSDLTNHGSYYIVFPVMPMLYFLWAQGAKRCHDIGKSGYWQFIPLFPIYLLFKDSVNEKATDILLIDKSLSDSKPNIKFVDTIPDNSFKKGKSDSGEIIFHE